MIKQIAGEAMGGAWVLMTASTLPAARLAALVQGEFDAVDACMSPWRADSEMNRISAAPPGRWLEVSRPLADVIALTLELERQTGGALGPSLGGEVSAAGFGPAGRPCGAGRLELEGRSLRKSAATGLDLCAVAKGYAIDRAGAALIAAGVGDFLLNASGDLLARGTHPEGRPWTVAVELPVPQKSVVYRHMPVQGALATSGTYRNQRDNGRRSHLIDGRSRAVVEHGLIGVSVLAETAALADGWATALAVLGPHDGPAKARELGLTALFLSQAEGGFIERAVGDWP